MPGKAVKVKSTLLQQKRCEVFWKERQYQLMVHLPICQSSSSGPACGKQLDGNSVLGNLVNIISVSLD